MVQIQIGKSVLSLILGDITEQETDAIVNAANSSLLGGGGVDGAIRRAGGPNILEECKAIRATHGECQTGEAVITSGGRLKAKHVIHAVGPIWHGGNRNESALLSDAYRHSLRVALENDIHTIAFPSISTGIYGFPIECASRIAFKVVKKFVREHPSIKEARFVVFSQQDFEVYRPLFQSQ
jgi:O-acetyl-ADP-ribose deacetylase